MSQFAPPEGKGPFVAPLPAKDRSVGLAIFGVVQVLTGLVCAMLIPLMAMSLVMGNPAGVAMPIASLVSAMVIYAFVAIVFIWLGIGSVLGRRWARALTLIFSWMWLIGGLFSMIAAILIMPDFVGKAAAQGNMPPAVLLSIRIVTFAILACIYILLPGAFVAFYQSRHVKATCERKDPVLRWTDRCPLPVLALSLMLACGVPSMLSLVAYNCLFPFFGTFLTGLPGAWMILIVAALFAWLAWGAYHQRVYAWWGTLLLTLGMSLSSFLTMSRVKTLEMFRLMGYGEEYLTMIRKTGVIDAMDQFRPWSFLVYGLLVLGYLWFTWKYFFVRPSSPPQANLPGERPGEVEAGSSREG
jgi:hypothetical protein